ncbi:MAG: GLPGLI family protein [Flavobacterium sp.]|jgi:GLPGLI family protein
MTKIVLLNLLYLQTKHIMKNFLILSFLIISATSVWSQKDFQGMAVYESKTSTAEMTKRFEGNKNITPEMQKTIEERMKSAFEKTFILNFDKTSSIYKEEEKVENGAQSGGGMRMMMNSMTGGGGTYYKNAKEKTYVVNKEFMGKEFLVKDSLSKLNWKMESESRVIGGYTCYKATAVKEASKTDFRNYRQKNKEEKVEVAKLDGVKKEESKSTSFLDEVELPKEIVVTAWYTPEIPVNQGPENYWGLPGLILEVNDGKTVMLCSKVVLNSKDKVAIKPATNGKVVSQKEYDETVLKKMEEYREMNGGGRGGMRFGK